MNAPHASMEQWVNQILSPAFGHIADACDLAASPDGRWISFTGTIIDSLASRSRTKIFLLDTASRHVSELGVTRGRESKSCWAPDSMELAFLSEADDGTAQPWVASLRAVRSGRQVATLTGSAEFLEWSPDGERLLLGVAPPGADLAGAAGSGRIGAAGPGVSEWTPYVETDNEGSGYRSAYIVDLSSSRLRKLGPSALNIWEASWSGPETVIAVASAGPGENSWYEAHLIALDVASGRVRELFRPSGAKGQPRQIGLPVASPSGRTAAVVTGLCSDRGVVGGDVLLIDMTAGRRRPALAGGTDVSHLAWRNDDALLFAGLRGAENVIGEISLPSGKCSILWSGDAFIGGSGWLPSVIAGPGRSVYTLMEQHHRPCQITAINDGIVQCVYSFQHSGTGKLAATIKGLESISWVSVDGTEIQGYLARPRGQGPYPLIVWVHGGPVCASVNRWILRDWTVAALIERGYAVFFPNPRGSMGRGQDFVYPIVGDMGGIDGADIISGLDYLLKTGIAHHESVGVTGASYGGFMTTWLATRDSRFSAGVAVAPITGWRSFRLTSNISRFADLFLGLDTTGGRNPVDYAKYVKAPFLTIVGETDECTPAAEGVQWHRALVRESQARSMLVKYPRVGHVPREFPELLDFSARVVDWFGVHVPARTMPEDG